MPIFGNGFIMDRLVMPCVLLIFVNPLIAPLTLWFWGIVAYSPTADEEEYDEWRGRVRHFETRVSEIVDHRSDQTEQRVSEQLTSNDRRVSEQTQQLAALVDRRVSEIQTDMRELRDQNAELRADIALLLAASRRG